MSINKVAIISDIHGNRWALEAVLEDISRRGITQIVNLGDIAYGPLEPKNTVSLIRSQSIISLQGNEDRILDEEIKGGYDSRIRDYVINQLDQSQLEWLKTLKSALFLRHDILMFHAMPDRDDRYLLYEVTPKYVRNRPENRILEILDNCQANLIFCGHSHMHRKLKAENYTIIDVGSVGLQAYVDDIPYIHKMENGDPKARYVILTINSSRYDFEICTITYDWESAASVAKNNGYPDWEVWLRTGKASQSHT